MSIEVSQAQAQVGRGQRRVRNYLLDHHFQLKYAGYLVGIAVVLSLALGGLLWSLSSSVIAQSRETVQRGQATVRQGQEVISESRKVSEVVRMSIVNDPVYAGNPELAAVFNQSASGEDTRLEAQQKALEADAVALRERAEQLARQQRQMFVALVVALTLLVVAIGAAGIVVTHKVAGPVYKMKRLIGEVGEGRLKLKERLRKGDELQHFFDAFERMVESLRRRQQAEITDLDAALASLRARVPDDQLAPLHDLRSRMQATLDAPPRSAAPAPLSVRASPRSRPLG